ncbi:MAG: gliding motility-associated C-terminal domain-containing protein [Flavobacterium sp. JAD_PAG50586_2]|nr:MAG: gliding motility-associated C-terminal domain-containing protein [Flavobacterium sp. JAD_PAG50586_2]
MKKIITLLILVIGVFVNAQTPPQIQWTKCLGDSDSDGQGIHDIIPTDDGGYIVAGNSRYVGDGDVAGGHGDVDYWLVKLDVTGTIIWQRSYGGSRGEELRRIAKAPGGGYFLAGMTYSNAGSGDVGGNYGVSPYADWWIVKIDDAGDIIWEENFGGTSDELLYDGYATADGGYIAVGSTRSANGNVIGNHNPTGSFNSDGWMIKLNSAGAIEWQRCYGGFGGTVLLAIQPTSDGGYITVGQTYALGGDIPATLLGGGNALAMKIDAVGNIIWTKLYGGSLGDGFSSVKIKDDGNYIVAGVTNSNDGDVSFNHALPGSTTLQDVWVVELDPVGNLLWEKTYGGTGNESPYQIHITGDCGYALAGNTLSTDFEGQINDGYIDGFLMKIDTTGQFVWAKVMGGEQVDRIWNFALTPDGGFVTVGNTRSVDGEAVGNHTTVGQTPNGWQGTFDNWIIKLGPDCLAPQFTTDTSVEVCAGGSATLTVNTVGQTIKWYSTQNATEPVFIGPQFVVAGVTQTTSYWVEVSDCLCVSERVEVIITISSPPVLSVQNAQTCAGSATTITASSVGNVINWYSSQTATQILFTGEQFTTPMLLQTTSYWVEAVSPEGCTSVRAEVSVTVNPLPVVTANTNVAICEGTTAVLTANSTAGNLINWFDSETETQPLASGVQFTTPILTQPTSYWVSAYNPQTNCLSDRIQYFISVNQRSTPVVDFDYQEESYCFNIGESAVLPVLAAGFSNGGVFSSFPGLVVNSQTGEIDVRNSQVGNYVVVYEINEDLVTCLTQGRFETGVTIKSCDIQRGISPNGDEFNQYFDLTGVGVKELVIYNRYGKEVYEATNYVKEWDGKDKSGNELPDGTYFYAISKNEGGNLTGWIYINREY